MKFLQAEAKLAEMKALNDGKEYVIQIPIRGNKYKVIEKTQAHRDIDAQDPAYANKTANEVLNNYDVVADYKMRNKI